MQPGHLPQCCQQGCTCFLWIILVERVTSFKMSGEISRNLLALWGLLITMKNACSPDCCQTHFLAELSISISAVGALWSQRHWSGVRGRLFVQSLVLKVGEVDNPIMYHQSPTPVLMDPGASVVGLRSPLFVPGLAQSRWTYHIAATFLTAQLRPIHSVYKIGRNIHIYVHIHMSDIVGELSC